MLQRTEMKTTMALNFMRSANPPTMSAGVMMANVICACGSAVARRGVRGRWWWERRERGGGGGWKRVGAGRGAGPAWKTKKTDSGTVGARGLMLRGLRPAGGGVGAGRRLAAASGAGKKWCSSAGGKRADHPEAVCAADDGAAWWSMGNGARAKGRCGRRLRRI